MSSYQQPSQQNQYSAAISRRPFFKGGPLKYDSYRHEILDEESREIKVDLNIDVEDGGRGRPSSVLCVQEGRGRPSSVLCVQIGLWLLQLRERPLNPPAQPELSRRLSCSRATPTHADNPACSSRKGATRCKTQGLEPTI